MKLLTSRLVAALAAASVLAAVPLSAARAETPKDMFVMATLLDEFTTLDPGEIYELVPEEYVANTYDRLVRVDLRDPSKFNGDVAQSWTVSTDGLTYTFAAPRPQVPLGQPADGRRRRLVDPARGAARQGPAAVLTGISSRRRTSSPT